jgi:hypothetical protein
MCRRPLFPYFLAEQLEGHNEKVARFTRDVVGARDRA